MISGQETLNLTLDVIKIIICILLLYNSKISLSKKLKIIVTTYFSLWVITLLLAIIHHVVFIYKFNRIYHVSALIGVALNFPVNALYGLFFKCRLEICYKGTFLEINKIFINTCFTIYVISGLISTISVTLVGPMSYWYPSIQSNFPTKIYNMSVMQNIIIIGIYSLVIIFLFHYSRIVTTNHCLKISI